MKYINYSISVLLFAVLFVGCSDSGSTPTGNDGDNNTPAATFTAVNALLSSSCSTGSTSCHGASSTSGYPMTSYDAIINHVASSGTTVDSANGAGSNLYLKTTSSPRFGSRMPLGGTALSSANQLLIKQWIDDGALNN